MLPKSAGMRVIALLAGMLACGGEPLPETSSALKAQQDAFLAVTNEHFLDVTIYALRAGTRQRIGTVSGLKADTLALPGAIVGGGSVRLLAEPIGTNQRHVTEPIQVGPGEWVEFTIRSPLNLSSVTIWRP